MEILFFVLYILVIVSVIYSRSVTIANHHEQIRAAVKAHGGQAISIKNRKRRHQITYRVSFYDSDGIFLSTKCKVENRVIYWVKPLNMLLEKQKARHYHPLTNSSTTQIQTQTNQLDKELLMDDLHSPLRADRLAAIETLFELPHLDGHFVQRLHELAHSDTDPLVEETAVHLLNTIT